MAEDTSGVVVLGLLGTAVGVFIVDHAMSEPGESWFDKLTGRGPEQAEPERREALPEHPEEHREAPPSGESPGFFEMLSRGLRGLVPSGAAPSGRAASPDVVREVQVRLNSLGLGALQAHGLIPADVQLPLAVDGILGRDTARVLAAAQQQLGVPVTGSLDEATLGALRQKTGAVRVPAARPPARPAARVPALPPRRPVTYRPAPSPEQVARRTFHIGQEVHGRVGANVYDEHGALIDLIVDESPLYIHGQARMLPNHVLAWQVEGEHPGVFAWIGAMDLRAGRSQATTHPQCPAGYGWDSWSNRCVLIDIHMRQQASAMRTGADAGDWKSEAASLGDAAVNVIQHALDQETKPRVLLGLSRALDAASLPITSAAVKAKAAALSPATKTGFEHLVGYPPGYEGGGSAGSCPPGTKPTCMPPPVQLVPLTSGEYAVGWPPGYEGGPFAMYCPPGMKPSCEQPEPTQLVPLTGVGWDGDVHYMGWW
ncbi:MAG TPA: peptidoglycan-binding domain-containing protein [Solirubrobacteraceae bacterium]|nr:peptidoglycan-binding domain-containing protein [Solirubrobacteraceae bacterium]